MSRFALLASTATLLAFTSNADPVLQKMRDQTKDGPVYAYEMEYTATEVTATGRVDPSQPEGSRIEVISPVEADWSEDFREGLEEMESETDGDIWCADFAETVPDNAQLVSGTDTTATYAFTPLPEEDADGIEKKLMKKIKGSITLDKQDGSILAFNMNLPKPYKPAMVAKISTFNMDAKCARAPDGRTYVSSFNMAIAGSAMMQKFEENVSRRITKLLNPVQ
jgi:hypothetical protein